MIMKYVKYKIISLIIQLAYIGKNLLARSQTAFKILFLPGYERTRWLVGKWKAWLVFEKAKEIVPAYKEFMMIYKECGVELKGWDPDFSSIPPIDKESYIKKYSIESRCINGMIPAAGVMIDESSGTSGTPNNWVRGYDERKSVKYMLQLSLRNLLGTEPVFLINAFALGPWATGMNVSMSLVDVTILKSTGPDILKIENTLNMFGPRYLYVIAGYPPFLKLLADSKNIEWEKYNVIAVFGGEGMSEGMRTYLSKSFKRIYGSYGASDLEINIGAENDFTIALRQLMLKNNALCKKLTYGNHVVLPMIFQYNPLDYYIETNDEGELLVTLCRISNISPKVRYNIHDLGHVWRLPELKRVLKEFEISLDDISSQYSDLPLLFHYGRSDMSVAFYGCKITPQNIEEVIFSLPELAQVTSSFSILVSEDKSANKKFKIAIELQEGINSDILDKDITQIKVLQKLTEVNQDYRESVQMIPDGLEPKLEIYDFAQGPFAVNDIRLKRHYIQKQ